MARVSRIGVAAALAVVLAASGASAQDVGGGAAPAGGNQVQTAPATTTTTTTFTAFGLPAPGTDINAGLPSSSRPTSDISKSTDSFDLSRGGAPSVRGGESGSIAILGGSRSEAKKPVPSIHTVKEGDTMWALCDEYFDSPYEWPKLWSLNPQIRNPHWIYPGDQLRMRSANAERSNGLLGSPTQVGGGGFVDRRNSLPKDTVFLRTMAFIDDPERDSWGEIVGSREEQQLLSDGNTVYMILRDGKDVSIGQELTVFRAIRPPDDVPGARKPPGEIVGIKGTVRIDQWNPQTRVARGQIIESTDAIERGFKIGQVGRRLDVVPPKANQETVWARVLSSVYPHVYLSSNQIVFLDRGSEDGVEAGNTFAVVRRGDTWRRTLADTTHMARDRLQMDVQKSVSVESTPLDGDEEEFPEEVVAEIRVLRTKKYSAVGLVVSANREIVPGDRAVARKGR